jgi:hypothetical protein
MTIVGKILVFVTMVFSLVAGGLMLVVFFTRANWQDAYNKQKALYDAAVADRNQYVQDFIAAKEQYSKAIGDLQTNLKAAEEARKDAETKAKTATDALAKINAKQRELGVDNKAVLEASTVRKDQVKELQASLDAARDTLRKQIELTNKEKAARIIAQINAKTFQSQATKLEEEVRDLARQLARKQLGPGTTTVVARKRGEDNPPAENIQGKIVTADPTSDLVRISVGSDAGLQPGHTLKAFRLDPIPENSKYLGTIEILSVRPHEAVGRPVRRTSFPLRPGDRVAARINVGGS